VVFVEGMVGVQVYVGAWSGAKHPRREVSNGGGISRRG
jgi:hypothetical protein